MDWFSVFTEKDTIAAAIKIPELASRLPEATYYYQDIRAAVVNEIVTEMQTVEPDSEAIDHWLKLGDPHVVGEISH